MKSSRRTFLKSPIGAQAAAMVLPMFATRSLREVSAPGNLINVGVIGTASMARKDGSSGQRGLRAFRSSHDERIRLKRQVVTNLVR